MALPLVSCGVCGTVKVQTQRAIGGLVYCRACEGMYRFFPVELP